MIAAGRAVLCCVLVGVAWAAPLAAQVRPASSDSATVLDSLERLIRKTVTVSGYIRDTSGRALPLAEVRVGDGDDAVATLSLEDGSFFLRGARPDSAVLLVRRIGYQPVERLLTVKAGLQVDIAVHLTPLAVTLGTIVVEGQRMNLTLMRSGFYDRQRRGSGTLFGPEYLQRFGGSVSGLLHTVAGVRISRDYYGNAVAMGRDGTSDCALNVFVDGMRDDWVREVGLDRALNKNDILAIEVYPRFHQLPGLLSGRGGSAGLSNILMHSVGARRCGALVIWRKTYEDKLAEKKRK